MASAAQCTVNELLRTSAAETSAGVAAAITEAAGGDPIEIFDSPYYDPNLHCYGLLRRILTEK